MNHRLEPHPPDPPHRVARPVMYQRWDSLTAIHWAVDPGAVQRSLPDRLTVDTHDGRAYVGLIPFMMEDIRPPGIPKGVPWIGTFPETNIRTYVRGPDGTPGVWFQSLDITRLAAVVVARGWYRLPYMWARMRVEREGTRMRYRGRRRWPGPCGAGSVVEVEVGEPIPPGEVTGLEHFLSARWGLFAWSRPRGLVYAPVEHPRWPLHRARLVSLQEDLVAAAGLARPDDQPHVAWSPGVDVRIGLPRRV